MATPGLNVFSEAGSDRVNIIYLCSKYPYIISYRDFFSKQKLAALYGVRVYWYTSILRFSVCFDGIHLYFYTEMQRFPNYLLNL